MHENICSMLHPIFSLILTVVLANFMALSLHFNEESNVRIKKEITNFMLPKNIVPTNYVVTLTPCLVKGHFDGDTVIYLDVLKATNKIVLHANNLKINESWTTLAFGNEQIIKPKKHIYDYAFDFLTLSFEKPLTPGNHILRIQFTGDIGTDIQGFYRSSYVNEDNDTVWIAATNFLPISARRAFPCWDEPAFKATFDILIKHYSNYTALSNMLVKHQTAVEKDGMLWSIFHKTPIMSTSAVGFALINFPSFSNLYGTTKVWSIDNNISFDEKTVQILENAISAIEEYTHVSLRVLKMDHVLIPNVRNLIINTWGLAMYSHDAIISDDRVLNTTHLETRNALATSYLTTHMRFVNLVTPCFWNYYWMSEGFAKYFTLTVANKLLPDWRLSDTYGVFEMPNALEADTPTPTTQLNRQVTKVYDIYQIYNDWIIPNKGYAILRMAAHTLSVNTFQRGVLKFLNKSANGTVSPDDLSEALQEAWDKSKVPHVHFKVKEFLDSWGNQPGYPLVTAIRNCTTGEIELTQDVFVPYLDHIHKYDSNAKWWIPITYATKSKPDFSQTAPKVWMKPQEEVTIIEGVYYDDWIVLNVQETGFYRVNYDDANWNRIARWLNSESYTDIHVINRANLINDAYYLITTKDIDPVIFFQLLSYLERETDPVVWKLGTKILDLIYPIIMVPKREQIFGPRILRLMDNIVKHVGVEEKAHDNHAAKSLRPRLVEVACRYEHVACITTKNEEFAEYAVKIAARVCKKARKADDTAWTKIRDIRRMSYKGRELLLLRCANNATVLENYLEVIGETESSSSMRDQVTSILRLDPLIVDTTLNYLIKNKETLKDVIDPSALLSQTHTSDQLKKIIGNFDLSTKKQQELLRRKQVMIDTWENAVSIISDWLQSPDGTFEK